MSEVPKDPIREKQERRIAAEAKKREIEREEAILTLLQEHADKTDQDRDSEASHKKVERNSWRRQAAIAKLQLKKAKCLNKITAIGAVFSLASAIGVITSVWITRISVIESNRAWIAIPRTTPVIDRQTYAIHFEMNYTNVGKGPALNLNWKIKNGLVNPPPNKDWSNLKMDRNSTCDKLMPDDTAGAVSFPEDPKELARKWRAPSDPIAFVTDDMRSGNSYLFVQGCVAYRTVGIIGRSSFCAIYVPTNPGSPILEMEFDECPIAARAE
jgi:hypothetical protein